MKVKRKARYNHDNYNSGVVVPHSGTGRMLNIPVSDLTEKEAKDELCYALDVIQYLCSLAHDLTDESQHFLENDTPRVVSK